jgi:hypothetical protein
MSMQVPRRPTVRKQASMQYQSFKSALVVLLQFRNHSLLSPAWPPGHARNHVDGLHILHSDVLSPPLAPRHITADIFQRKAENPS